MAEEDHSTNQGAAPPSIELLIERWWADHFPGSAVARDTQAWNIAHAAQRDAEAALEGE